MKFLSDFEFADIARKAASILASIEVKLDFLDSALEAHIATKSNENWFV